jgi:hypothetical protein
MRRVVSKKPFDVMIEGKLSTRVKSPEEYEKLLKEIDRDKKSVRLVC